MFKYAAILALFAATADARQHLHQRRATQMMSELRSLEVPESEVLEKAKELQEEHGLSDEEIKKYVEEMDEEERKLGLKVGESSSGSEEESEGESDEESEEEPEKKKKEPKEKGE